MTSYGFSPEGEFEDTLRDGITAAKNDSRKLARRLLERCIRMDPYDARPWLWLTEITDDPDEKRACLESALAADPYNIVARRAIALLDGKIKAEDLLPTGEGVQPRQNQEPIAAQTEKTLACSQCGGQTEFNPQSQTLQCLFCGFEREIDAELAADSGEQVLEFVLPTRRGHQWAEAQHHLKCQNCGADSLWPTGQRALRCPFCGSNQLIESQETKNLVDPQVIGPIEIDQKQALHLAEEWLGKGWFTPDDLSTSISAQETALRPAYYPFWTFDGILELHWRCEVNEGSDDNPHWVSRSGVEYQIFDDMLVSGSKSITREHSEDIRPFKLKEVVEFKPEFLAGWPALTYDISLADATLIARELIIGNFRNSMHLKILPHRKKRNLSTGHHKWSGMTFKYVLLPIWVGTYHYKGQSYSILVNGQTGEVSGKKPRDSAITFATVLSIILTIIAILIGTAILGFEMGWLTF